MLQGTNPEKILHGGLAIFAKIPRLSCPNVEILLESRFRIVQ